ncbi:MAG: ABC transporter permease [Gammaproteobacteria bacterium]|nr:ABC transporter permease [Gammaproteobacteria bacterium]
MFRYYLRLALLSLKRNPILSTLMVAAIGIGIGVCMTALTVYYLMSADPIPAKSSQLFAVQLDSWDPNQPVSEARPEQAPWQLTYRDAMALRESDIATHETAMYYSARIVVSENEAVPPFLAWVRLADADFFSMFGVPFLYGGPWSSEVDETARPVVVLSKRTNEQVFGGANSVGSDLQLDDQIYRVVGVLEEWNPIPKIYDVNNGPFNDTEDIFLPFSLAELASDRRSEGNTSCWKDEDITSYTGFLNSECVWIQYWAELDSPAQVREYQAFLDNYVREQQRLGRFERPLNNRLTSARDWLDVREVVRDDNRVLVSLAFMFLAVCVLNTVGLLLAKFAGKAPQISLRRALGASRGTTFAQYLVEIGLVGIAGGLLGLGLAFLGLAGVRSFEGEYSKLAHLDPVLVGAAILIALLSSLAAGLYPTWRACRIPPAAHLKTQ